MKKIAAHKILSGILLTCIYIACTATTQAVNLTVTNNMLFHFKVEDGSLDEFGTQATNNIDVQTWRDQSGNGYDISPTSSGRRPTYELNIASNGMPGLYFDGANDMLYRAILDPGTVTINTLFLVFTPTNSIDKNSAPAQVLLNSSGFNEQIALGAYTGALTDEILGTRSRNSGNTAGMFSAYSTATESISGLTVLSVVYNPTDSAFDLYLNGNFRRNVKSGTDDNGFRFINEPFYLGAQSATESHFGGHILEVITYTNVLSTTDRESVENYLNFRFSETNRTITASAGTGGSISPPGNINTHVMTSIDFQIEAKWGYHIDDILINGSSMNLNLGINPKSYTYSWANITDDGTISVTFATDDKTLSITNNMAFRLTSTDGLLDEFNANAAPGDEIQTWQDQSGNGNDFQPTFSTRRPLLEENISTNGQQGLLFDGTNDTMRWLANVNPASIIMAFKPTTAISSSSSLIFLMNGGNDQNAEAIEAGPFTGTFTDELIGIRSKDSSSVGMQAAIIDGTGTIDNFTIFSAIHDPVNNKWNLYLNGDSSKNTSLTDDNGFAITGYYLYFGSSSTLSGFFGGHFFEIIAYTNSLSSVDRESVESYLKFKFTSPEPPPSGTLVILK